MEVDKFNDIRNDKLQRLRIAEREKEMLEGPKNEAEAFVRTEKERLTNLAYLQQSDLYQEEKVRISIWVLES